jgi:hypothetical protein
MNGAITEGVGEGVVDEPVLFDERQAVEPRTADEDLEVVAAAGSVLDRQLVRVGKSLFEEAAKPVDAQRASPR